MIIELNKSDSNPTVPWPGIFMGTSAVRARTRECSPRSSMAGYLTKLFISSATCVTSSRRFTRQYHRENPFILLFGKSFYYLGNHSYSCKFAGTFSVLVYVPYDDRH